MSPFETFPGANPELAKASIIGATHGGLEALALSVGPTLAVGGIMALTAGAVWRLLNGKNPLTGRKIG